MTFDNLHADAAPASEGRPIIVDAEHFGIRFLVPILTIGLVIGAHLAGVSLLERSLPEGLSAACVMLPLDAVIFLGGGYLIERGLKHRLPSRRTATLNDDALILTDRRHNPPRVVRIDWDRTVNVNAWRFTVHRKTRVPKGWHCLAVQLLQDEAAVILYTFMAAQEAEALPGYANFVRLRPRKETRSNTDLRAVAEQRRLLKLEDERWTDGAEIARDDFQDMLDVINRHVTGWV